VRNAASTSPLAPPAMSIDAAPLKGTANVPSFGGTCWASTLLTASRSYSAVLRVPAKLLP
jgi:hypothetical protein